jgi:hypothetical protein
VEHLAEDGDETVAAAGGMPKVKPPEAVVESRAAKARTSAQETTPGQMDSRADLILFTASYPRRAIACFSVFWLLVLGSSRMDASQPCKTPSVNISILPEKLNWPLKVV